MSTIIRPVIAANKPYYISKHRYYELKHHCLQYNEWKQELLKLRSRSLIQSHMIHCGKNIRSDDKTAYTGLLSAHMTTLMDNVEKCSVEAGGDIANYIFTAVTEGKSYSTLNPPCGKEYFYKKYRMFFYLLSQNYSML